VLSTVPVKRAVAPLVGERVRLRLLDEPDLPLTLAWRNQDRVRHRFFHSQVLTPEQHCDWYARYCQRADDYVFVIEETQSLRAPIGQAALYRVDWEQGRAEFGRLMIGEPAALGQGFARAATALLVEHALTAWRLRAVYLEVYADNFAARAVYAACGFRVTGQSGAVVTMLREAPVHHTPLSK
jgi:RimJ/RimL family protein N-acetyltransferase